MTTIVNILTVFTLVGILSAHTYVVLGKRGYLFANCISVLLHAILPLLIIYFGRGLPTLYMLFAISLLYRITLYAVYERIKRKGGGDS